VTASTPVVTLQEGNTPLLPAPELSRRTGCEVYLKVEGLNPTGSFKDRGMTMAISKAVEEGSKAVICASTGTPAPTAPPSARPAGSAPIVTGAVVEHPETIATAIRIGNPASWTKPIDAREASGGRIDAVTDRAILQAYRLRARSEAVFVEPASAASVAGLLQV